jgi:hypothetical protein
MFRCKDTQCGHILTKEEIKNAHYCSPEDCVCPSCLCRGIEPYTVKMGLSWDLKVLIDVAINMGILMAGAKVPDYGNYNYYQELTDLAVKFLNTPAPTFDYANEETFYVNLIDKFAEEELLKLFGGKVDGQRD